MREVGKHQAPEGPSAEQEVLTWWLVDGNTALTVRDQEGAQPEGRPLYQVLGDHESRSAQAAQGDMPRLRSRCVQGALLAT